MKKIYLLHVIGLLLLVINSRVNAQTTYYVDIIDYGILNNIAEMNSTGYSINGEVEEYNGYTAQPAIHIAIIDSATCTPLSNCNLDFGQINLFLDPNGDCIYDNTTLTTGRQRAENYFIFRSNENAQMQSMARLIDSVGTGNYIIAYSWMPSPYSLVDTSFVNVFQRLGSTMIPSLQDSLPFIFFCRKGDAGSVVETSGAYPGSLIFLDASFICYATGINEIGNETVHIFPNPATDDFSIDLGNQNDQISRISIYNVLGELITEINSPNQQETISTKNFPAGFYFVKVEGDNFKATRKICVIHN